MIAAATVTTVLVVAFLLWSRENRNWR